MNTTFIVFVLVLLLVVFLLYRIRKKLKTIKLDSVSLITGGVKCGKTTLAVHLAIKTYKRALRRYYVRKFFQSIFHLKVDERPLLYSNIPLKCDYVPLEFSHLTREKRFNYKSVVLLSESSLICGSMDYKDENINERLTLFVKLFGHETRGGSLFIETQNVNDNHYSFKRGINRFIWIYNSIKIIPFVIVYQLREMYYMDGDNNTMNTFNDDIENTMKYYFVSKRTWKKFDTYCYSAITDGLDNSCSVTDGTELKTLKTNELLRFKYFKKGDVKKK